jgi:hypothetical protein
MIAAPSDIKGEIASGIPASRFAYGPAVAAGSMLAALLR